MDVQQTTLSQLCYVIMSIWSKIYKERFQDLIESMPGRIKAGLEAKGGLTWCLPGVCNEVASECRLVN